MRERIFILISLVVIIAALVALNAASYVRLEQEADTEAAPNRSTFNAGATGTRAFYDLLRDTGARVVRWQEKPSALLGENATPPDAFVIVGRARRRLDDDEARDLLEWTNRGGRLVLIDRSPSAELLKSSGVWRVSTVPAYPNSEISPDNVAEMTRSVIAAKPAQPTLLTSQVNSAMPSQFAAAINFQSIGGAKTVVNPPQTANSSGVNDSAASEDEDYDEEPPPPPKSGSGGGIGNGKPVQPTVAPPQNLSAPVVHLASGEKVLLVDYAYGAGRVVVLSDPFVVSNSGIGLTDNLQLARNVVGNGVIAFDEYHQGYGASGNALLNYFAGTPLPAIAAQLALLALVALWTRGRRFARALPPANPDRRSKLEYVGAMAELLRRAKTYDLAIENIYARVRRNLARYAGVDNAATSNAQLAARVAERSKINRSELENLLVECENAIQGERLVDKKALALAGRLRETEQRLVLTKRASNNS